MIRPWPIAVAAVLLCLAASLVVGLNLITGLLFAVSPGAGAAGILIDRRQL